MELSNYKNDGWGLSLDAFSIIFKVLRSRPSWKILEFGSGTSTQFFLDYKNEFGGIQLDSFDDDPKWAHPYAKIRPLYETSDAFVDCMFSSKFYDDKFFKKRTILPHTRQRNCFYKLEPNDLRSKYDFVLVDGPHGNGRAIAFLHLLDRLSPEAYIFIDDFNHYNFEERFKSLFSSIAIQKKVSPNDNFLFLKLPSNEIDGTSICS
jgi:hypothetical protein